MARFWNALHRDAKAVLLVCVVINIFNFGVLYRHWRNTPSLPPLFKDAPQVAVANGKAATILVDVSGAVRHPGLVTLPVGTRLESAIEAAGGATEAADAQSLNLAGRLTDGQKIVVPLRGIATVAQTPPATQHNGTKMLPAQPVNINRADAAALQALPGIGPAMAGRIIEWRTQKGAFATIDDLRNVKGIGARKLEKLRPYVSL